MARCGCSSDRCACTIEAGAGALVTGQGTASNPYVVSMDASSGGGTGGVTRLTGEVVAYAGATPPAGWLLMNGAAVSRTTYADLYAVIGIDYGAGDGVTTFNLPNTTGRFLRGANSASPRGGAGGTTQQVLSAVNVPAHTHPLTTAGSHKHPLDLSTAPGGTGANVPLGTTTRDRISDAAVELAGDHTHVVGANTGGGQPFDILPPFLSVNYIIKT